MRPGRDTCYRLTSAQLRATRELLLPSARKRVEGTVVWWARMVARDVADVIAVYRPRQRAYRSRLGLSVEVPQDAISEMILALPTGAFIAARLHTHGTEAYHSSLDDRNLLIAHDGAISVVIPFFAREPIDLAHCSVNMLLTGRGWIELPASEVRRRFQLIDA